MWPAAFHATFTAYGNAIFKYLRAACRETSATAGGARRALPKKLRLISVSGMASALLASQTAMLMCSLYFHYSTIRPLSKAAIGIGRQNLRRNRVAAAAG